MWCLLFRLRTVTENYSDKNAKEVYMQSLTDNRRLRDETFAYLKPLSGQ